MTRTKGFRKSCRPPRPGASPRPSPCPPIASTDRATHPLPAPNPCPSAKCPSTQQSILVHLRPRPTCCLGPRLASSTHSGCHTATTDLAASGGHSFHPSCRADSPSSAGSGGSTTWTRPSGTEHGPSRRIWCVLVAHWAAGMCHGKQGKPGRAGAQAGRQQARQDRPGQDGARAVWPCCAA